MTNIKRSNNKIKQINVLEANIKVLEMTLMKTLRWGEETCSCSAFAKAICSKWCQQDKLPNITAKYYFDNLLLALMHMQHFAATTAVTKPNQTKANEWWHIYILSAAVRHNRQTVRHLKSNKNFFNTCLKNKTKPKKEKLQNLLEKF